MAQIIGRRNPKDEEKIELYGALRNGDVGTITTMFKTRSIDINANLDDVDTFLGQTALHLAVIYKQMKSIKALVQLGASIDTVNYNGHTPLHHAIEYGYNEIVNYFVMECKQNIDSKWFDESLKTKALAMAKGYRNEQFSTEESTNLIQF